MDNCLICLFPQQGNDPAYLNCCDHYFHMDCIVNWTKVSSTCPLCVRRIQQIFFKRVPYDVKHKLQVEDEAGEGHRGRNVGVVTDEEQRCRLALRKQARLLHDATEIHHKRKEAEARQKQADEEQRRVEYMNQCWADFQRFKDSSMEDPRNLKQPKRKFDLSASTSSTSSASPMQFIKSSFVRDLVEDMRGEKADGPIKLSKRPRIKSSTPIRQTNAFPSLTKIHEILNVPADSMDMSAIINELSVLPYSKDISFINTALANGLLDELLNIISASEPTMISELQKEICLRVINSIYISPGSVSHDQEAHLKHYLARDASRPAGCAVASRILRAWDSKRC